MTLLYYDYQGYYASATSWISLSVEIYKTAWINFLATIRGTTGSPVGGGGYTLGTMNGYAKFCDNFSNSSQ